MGDDGADGVAAEVLWSGLARTIPIEARHRVGPAGFQRAAEHIAICHGAILAQNHALLIIRSPKRPPASRAGGQGASPLREAGRRSGLNPFPKRSNDPGGCDDPVVTMASVERRRLWMKTGGQQGAWLPPRWFVRLAWSTHRGIYRASGGRVGLRRPKGNSWGTARLTTTGRRTGEERSVMVGYFEEDQALVTMAMNGWGEGEPAWWLNLQAEPRAVVETVDGRTRVTGRAAEGEERARLWHRWQEIDTDLDEFAARRSGETAVVVLEPVSGA